jgi:hypothetical protein
MGSSARTDLLQIRIHIANKNAYIVLIIILV